MSEHTGRERRRGADRRAAQSIDENTVELLRCVVRDELGKAAKDGRILSDEDRHTLHAWLVSRRLSAARWEKARTTVLGAVCVAALGWLGLILSKLGALVIEAAKVRMHQP